VLALLALALIAYVYRRDGRSRPARILLGGLRVLLVALVLGWLGRTGPVSWHLPVSANRVLRDIGLALFIARVGIDSGTPFVQAPNVAFATGNSGRFARAKTRNRFCVMRATGVMCAAA